MQGLLSCKAGLYAQADDRHDPQRTPGTGLQPRHVVAGNIFHDLTAELQILAFAIDQLYTKHRVSNGTKPWSPGPAQPAGHCPTQGTGISVGVSA